MSSRRARSEGGVEVPLTRLARWIDGFAERHGAARSAALDAHGGWLLTAEDGAQATIKPPPWLPLVEADATLERLPDLRPTYGVLLLRRAGYAVAVVDGLDVRERKVGTRHVHGRTAAGGWSQQRYARRRANQADEIVLAAAAHVDRVVGEAGDPRPVFLVTGGDRLLLADAQDALGAAAAALPVVTRLAVGHPDARVLLGVPERVLAVHIRLA